MDIHLKERKSAVLNDLDVKSTFKIDGSSLVFMRIDVDGLTVVPKKPEGAQEDLKPIKVQIPEGKTPVLCLDTGRAQFLNLNERVKVVELEANEILDKKESQSV